MAFEDVIANYEAARKGQGMLRPVRSDYYGNEFAIQNSLDAALAQKQLEDEAQRIVDDPVLLQKFLSESGMSSDSMPTGRGVPTVVNGTPTAAGILDKTYLADILGKIGKVAPGMFGMLASGGGYLLDLKAGSDFNKFNETQDRNTQLMRGGGLTKSDMEGNVFGFNPSANTYTSSYGTTTSLDSLSPEAQAGLAANMESFGSGSDKDYYGD
jgi:hypothetical protein